MFFIATGLRLSFQMFYLSSGHLAALGLIVLGVGLIALRGVLSLVDVVLTGTAGSVVAGVHRVVHIVCSVIHNKPPKIFILRPLCFIPCRLTEFAGFRFRLRSRSRRCLSVFRKKIYPPKWNRSVRNPVFC